MVTGETRRKKHGKIVLRLFFFNNTATTEIYTLSLHDALPILRSRSLRYFKPLDEFGEEFRRRAPLQRFALLGEKVQQFLQRGLGCVKGQLSLRRLQHVVERGAALFRGPLGKAHQIARFQVPCRRGENTRAGDVIEGFGDHPEIRKQVLDDGMIEDREPGNHERDGPAYKFFDEFIAMGVLAVKNGKIAPWMSCGMEALQFQREPARLVKRISQF